MLADSGEGGAGADGSAMTMGEGIPAAAVMMGGSPDALLLIWPFVSLSAG